jgi:DNA-directed RNA polymerase specialized sigma24 family protein
VFVMREWLETKAQYICTELGITSNHCGAMLYRARMQFLRGALRRIGKEEPPCAE